MARYKPQDRNSMLLPIVLSEQIVPGSFAFALDYLVDNELDLTAMDAQFKNDEVGASAYDPRVLLKIVLLAYSQGLISSRVIEQACLRNVQFIALSGDSQPSHTHIAKFVCSLSDQIKPLFSQVLMTCDAQGLIGRDMFAIDGVKLPSNASKERSGTHEELRHRVKRLDRAAEKILELHQTQDKSGDGAVALEPKRQGRIDALRKEAARTREFLSTAPKRQGGKGKELKSNVTDPESAKMATSKGVMQGYPGAQPLAVLMAMLQRSTASDFHALWSNDISLLDATWFNHGWVHNHKHLTDVYLLGLAVKNKGRLVTFEQRIALNAVHGAKAENLVVL